MVTWHIKIIDCTKGEDSKSERYFEHVGSSVTIGRGVDSDLQLQSQGISRRHTRLLWDSSSAFVEDLGSTNGTWLANDKKWRTITARKKIELPAYVRLADGVVVQVLSIDFEGLQIEDTVSEADNRQATSMAFTDFDFAQCEKLAAIMVLDLCSSTSTSFVEGDIMGYHMKVRLNEIVTPHFKAYNATFIKNTGDGFLVTFDTVKDAYCAGLDIFNTLHHRNNATTNPPINVRLGLHFGKVYQLGITGDDIHGNDVNLAFRIEGIDANKITHNQAMIKTNNAICTKEFLQELDSKSQHVDLGQVTLKGVPAPVDLYLLDIQPK